MLTTALLSLVLAPSAHAGAFMWGVGPSISTVVFPVSYPGALPTTLPEEFAPEPARADVQLAGRGLFYLNKDSRIGARGGFGFGRSWGTRWIDVEYERILTSEAGFHLLFGGGIGLGSNTFTDDLNNRLDVAFMLGRAQFGATYRDKVRAYELALFGQYPLPLEHRYTPASGQEETLRGRGARYGQLGMEVTVLFGDFTPARRAGGKRKVKGKTGRSR